MPPSIAQKHAPESLRCTVKSSPEDGNCSRSRLTIRGVQSPQATCITLYRAAIMRQAAFGFGNLMRLREYSGRTSLSGDDPCAIPGLAPILTR